VLNNKEEPVVEEFVAEDETANWKTYDDPILNMGLKYPPDWTMEVDRLPDNRTGITLANQNLSSEESQAKPRYTDFQGATIQNPYPQDIILIQILKIDDSYIQQYKEFDLEYQTALEWYNGLKQKEEKAHDVFRSDASSLKNITVNQKSAVFLRYSSALGNTAMVLYPLKNEIAQIIIFPYGRFEEQIVNQILSTFKFIE